MKRSATTFLLLTALCAFIFAPAAASAQTLTKAALQQRIVIENQLRNDLFYGALNASSQTGDVAGTLKILSEGLAAPLGQLPSTDVALQWLLDNTFEQADAKKINAFYFMVLADLKTPIAATFQATGKDVLFKDSAQLALKALMTYEILAFTDAERCDDPSVAAKVIPESLGPRYGDLAFAFKSMTKEQFDLLGYYATELERLKADRPVNKLLCAKGDKAKADPTYKPKDLDPLVWLQRRTDLRLAYKNIWSKRYYDYQKPQPVFSTGAGTGIAPPVGSISTPVTSPLSGHGAVPGVPTDMPISPPNNATPAPGTGIAPTVTPPANSALPPAIEAPGITNPSSGNLAPAPVVIPDITNPAAANPAPAPSPSQPATDTAPATPPAAPAPFTPLAPQTAPPPAFTPAPQ